MRLAVIVSEFPKTSETFVLRDLVKFRQLGADIRLYHLAPYRKRETLHDFARPVRDWVRRLPMLPLTTAAGVAAGRPRVVARLLADMTRGLGGEPVLLAKSLALTPRMLAIAEDAAIWGADHVHAAFAAHPATAAWMTGRLTGIPYSVSCHAHDIFSTHALLDRKLGEAAFVRTISDYNKAYLLRHVPGLTPRQIRVIRCGMDLSTLAPLPAPQPAAAFRMLFVGRLAPQKGIDVLLRAMTEPNAAPHWRLTVIGDGPERRRLTAMARALGVAPRVSWLGARGFEVVAQAYGEADVVVA
ncbi:MAG: glycosyltransferase family 4 protein, partial [Alphaproteobacteria bacterium]|nr:glycosyltransferase family 4 protein [Alphaproteobacteria bacterium]